MKPYSLCILFILVSLYSCGVKPLAIGECDIETQMDKNQYSRILRHTVSNPIASSNKEQITQLNFECIYIQAMPKALYDRFGIWSRVIQLENPNHPILIWDNINLGGVAERITIISNHFSTKKGANTDIIILDQYGKDLLIDDSPQKTLLISYFGMLLRESNISNDEFFTLYDTTFVKGTH